MRRLTSAFIFYTIALLLISHINLPANIFSAAFAILFLGGIITVYTEYRCTLNEFNGKLTTQLEEKESNKRKLLLEDKELDDYLSELKQKEMMIISLYEITKKMSNDLTFHDIFKALSAFLKENFIFKKAELLILKEDLPGARVEKIYRVYKNDEEESSEEESDYDGILKLFAKDKKEIFISKKDTTFSAIPLLSENKFVGILTVENLAKSDFDKLVIVAMQFALETKKVLLYETVEELAITDSLTGLYARRYFFERMNEEQSRSKRHNFNFAFLMADIDDFKACNDTYGHMVGDVVLRDVARLIKESVREIDLVARYGGEEFSLVLPETDKKGALMAAERIRKKIEEHVFRAYDEKPKITVSIGLAVYPEDSGGATELIEKADKALYDAKKSGKNIVCEYKP